MVKSRATHPIEQESYRRLRTLVDLSHLPPLSRAVAERVVHASADLDYVTDLVLDEAALERGAEALLAGSPVVVDVEMVAAGIPAVETICGLTDDAVPRLALSEGLTRTAAGLRVASRAAGPGAVYVVGNAPTALVELLHAAERGANPAFVVGLPVGFVGAVEAKRALRDARLPAVTNRGRKGGSAVAAAALNALLHGGVA
jgi:precorrin-8X/cobalt-precorrin-8 methylmutase